jgi:hypothetical protein
VSKLHPLSYCKQRYTYYSSEALRHQKNHCLKKGVGRFDGLYQTGAQAHRESLLAINPEHARDSDDPMMGQRYSQEDLM